MNERGGGIRAFHAERECRLKYSISGKKNVFSGSSKYNVDEKLDIKKKKCVGVRSYRANGFHFLS